MADNWEQVEQRYSFEWGNNDHYKDSKVSILVGSKYIEKFQKNIQSLINTCTNVDATEIIVKVDGQSEIDPYRKCLMDSPFRFKLLCYPQYRGYFDYNTYTNDLSRNARGKILWCMSDDMQIENGDWFKILTDTRNKYKDNIYAVCMREMPRRPTANPCPAVSIEWFKFFGFFSPVSNIDTFVSRLAHLIGRYVMVPEKEAIILAHEGPHGYMKKEKYTPLKKKQKYVENLCQQYAKIFKKKIG